MRSVGYAQRKLRSAVLELALSEERLHRRLSLAWYHLRVLNTTDFVYPEDRQRFRRIAAMLTTGGHSLPSRVDERQAAELIFDLHNAVCGQSTAQFPAPIGQRESKRPTAIPLLTRLHTDMQAVPSLN